MPSFDPAKLARAFAVVSRGVEQGAFPGAVAAVGGANGAVAIEPYGYAAVEPEFVPMRADTLFDLASLTKVVATTPAVLHLVEQGAFVLETPVHQILPEVLDNRITIRHLLTHTSGLPGWRGLYLDHRGWTAYTEAIGQIPPTREPGTAVEYSDLGFILLGAVIQRVTSSDIESFVKREIFDLLAMTKTYWRPARFRDSIAATEKGNQVEFRMCGDRAPQFSRWRTDVLCGEVNDGNAWYGLDGVSSHAGLFGTASDLVLYARAWLRGGDPILGRHMSAAATRSYTAGMSDNRGLGWQKPPVAAFPTGRASCGDLLSAAAYGHTGFTGTSLWMDPEKDLFVILLTNRLHPAAKDGLAAVRPAFHNAVVAALC